MTLTWLAWLGVLFKRAIMEKVVKERCMAVLQQASSVYGHLKATGT